MARLLAAVGTVSYNGFTFPAPFDAEVTAVPRRDTTGRYIKYVVYTITISTVIVPDDAPTATAGDPVDANMENIRCRLTKSGGAFQFNNQGLGTNLSINTNPGSRLDPLFGPHPTILTWRPIGSNRACQIVWSVEVTVPECCGTIINPSLANLRLLEYSYTVSWDVNDEGATIRIIQGRAEMPGYRQTIGAATGPAALRTPQINADKHWENIYRSIQKIPGFRREHRRSLSADRRFLDFTVIDTEVASDNPLYPFMVKMDVTHDVDIRFPNIGRAFNSIKGAITIAPRTPRHFAWIAFQKLVWQRYLKGSTGKFKENKGGGTEEQKPARAIILGFFFSEKIYGREFVFAVDWWFGLGNIHQVFQGSGLFQPVTAAANNQQVSWAAWTLSLEQVANSVRGLAGLIHNPTNDIMIQVCEAQPTIPINNVVRKGLNTTQNIPQPDPPARPTKSNSWMDYNQFLTPRVSSNVVRHRKLKDVKADTQKPPATNNPHSDKYSVSDMYGQAALQEDSIVEQVRGGPSAEFNLSGNAMRIGFPISLPKLTGVGGKTVKILGIVATQAVIGQYFELPIYAAQWAIDFSLSGMPSGDLMTNNQGDAMKAR